MKATCWPWGATGLPEVSGLLLPVTPEEELNVQAEPVGWTTKPDPAGTVSNPPSWSDTVELPGQTFQLKFYQDSHKVRSGIEPVILHYVGVIWTCITTGKIQSVADNTRLLEVLLR